MARTPSSMLSLGTPMADFTLPDVNSGRELSSGNLPLKRGTLVMFICNHCPFVKHVLNELVSLSAWAQDSGFNVMAINSNDIEKYPEDSPDKMKELSNSIGLSIPYLFDETQEIAKLFDAACTPDFYLFDSDKKLVYRGQLDDSRPGNNIPVTGASIREAISAIVTGTPISEDQIPSLGCNIKWKN